MANLEIRKITATGESRLEQDKRDLEKKGYREILPKEEKYLTLNQYFITRNSEGWTMTYTVPGKPSTGKPL